MKCYLTSASVLAMLFTMSVVDAAGENHILTSGDLARVQGSLVNGNCNFYVYTFNCTALQNQTTPNACGTAMSQGPGPCTSSTGCSTACDGKPYETTLCPTWTANGNVKTCPTFHDDGLGSCGNVASNGVCTAIPNGSPYIPGEGCYCADLQMPTQTSCGDTQSSDRNAGACPSN